MEEIEDDYVLHSLNKIYVYMGTYKTIINNPEFPLTNDEVITSENDPDATYKKFYELDSGLPSCINVGNLLDEFENDNKIIIIPNVRDYENESTFEDDFNKLRKIYLKTLCISGEEAAIDLVTSKEYIAKVFSVENYMKENQISSIFYQAFFDAAICNKKDKVLKR